MPPFLIVALGAMGAAALVKLLAGESRRVNAELRETRQESDVTATARERSTLRRDPATGEYRPTDS